MSWTSTLTGKEMPYRVVLPGERFGEHTRICPTSDAAQEFMKRGGFEGAHEMLIGIGVFYFELESDALICALKFGNEP